MKRIRIESEEVKHKLVRDEKDISIYLIEDVVKEILFRLSHLNWNSFLFTCKILYTIFQNSSIMNYVKNSIVKSSMLELKIRVDQYLYKIDQEKRLIQLMKEKEGYMAGYFLLSILKEEEMKNKDIDIYLPYMKEYETEEETKRLISNYFADDFEFKFYLKVNDESSKNFGIEENVRVLLDFNLGSKEKSNFVRIHLFCIDLPKDDKKRDYEDIPTYISSRLDFKNIMIWYSGEEIQCYNYWKTISNVLELGEFTAKKLDDSLISINLLERRITTFKYNGYRIHHLNTYASNYSLFLLFNE